MAHLWWPTVTPGLRRVLSAPDEIDPDYTEVEVASMASMLKRLKPADSDLLKDYLDGDDAPARRVYLLLCRLDDMMREDMKKRGL